MSANCAVIGGQVLVVPPFECAWLTGSGDNPLLRDGKGCVSFEVKGDNDVTVIFKPQSGSRRWQHLSTGQRHAGAVSGRQSPVEANYTVILGSHRNSCLKFERNGELCHSVVNAPGSKLSATSFTKFWINYDRGTITVGSGEPGASTARCSWTDPDPLADIRFAGLSAWDKHVGYRNIRVQPAVDFSQQAAAPSGEHADPLPTLVELCCRTMLRMLSPSAVCAVVQAADAIAPVIDGLRAHAVECAARHFADLLHADPAGFQALSLESMSDILRSQSLVCGEKAAFDALMRWAGDGSSATAAAGPLSAKSPLEALDAASPADDVAPTTPPPTCSAGSPCARRPLAELDALLPLIRFPLMTDEELAAAGAHPARSRSALLRELLLEAADARREGGSARGAASVRAPRLLLEPSASEAAASARFQRRRPSGCTELIYMYDGDHNGACWHVATRYGTRQWVNPVSAGLLAARASSPSCRSTDPRALLSGHFLRTNFAGPRREGDGLSTWWLLDFGPGHALECNYYTLRHDASTDFLRSWALQGSPDGCSWVDLRRHVDDRTIKLPGQYASWPVDGPAAATPQRFFRVLLLAPNALAPNPRHVCLSYIELYGNFYASRGAVVDQPGSAGEGPGSWA